MRSRLRIIPGPDREHLGVEQRPSLLDRLRGVKPESRYLCDVCAAPAVISYGSEFESHLACEAHSLTEDYWANVDTALTEPRSEFELPVAPHMSDEDW